MNSAKQLYEKMIDFKRFATLMLAVGAFFFIGVIIPTETKNMMDLNIMIAASSVFLAGSILFFTRSKQIHKQLMDTDEGQDFLMKK